MAKSKVSIILALDGEQKFSAGMKSAQASVKLCDQELKNLQQECKGSANTVETLTKKNELLKKSQEAYAKVLEAAKAGEKNARDNYKKASSELDNLKKKLDLVERQYKETGKATDEAGHSAEDYREAIERQQTKLSNAEAALSNWEAKVSKASVDVRKASTAVSENSRYLNEAKASADGCATSIDGFGKAVSEAGKQAEESSGKISAMPDAFSEIRSGFLGGIGLNLATGLAKIGDMAVDAAKKIVEAGKAAAAYADEVLTTAEVTGMSTDRIQELTYAAGLMDTELSTIEGSMRKNIASMRSAATGSKEYAKAYSDLGVSVKKADGSLRDSEEVFWDTIDALGRIEDRTERDAAAMKLFGKSAQELNPLIAKGSKGFNELAKEAHDVGYVLGSETLEKLGGVQDSFDRLDMAGKNFGNAVGSVVAPALGGLADIAANVLNGIAGLFRDNRSEAVKFAEELEESTGKAREALEGMKGWEAESSQEVGKLEAYRDILQEVADAESANAYQKHQVSQIVAELGGRVPELTDAWDEQTGTLKLTRDEINNLINAQEDYARQQVLIKARSEAYEALYTAELNAAKAQGQLNSLFDKASELVKGKVHGAQGEILGTIRSLDDLQTAYNELSDSGDNELLNSLSTIQFEATKAQEAIEATEPVIKDCNEELGKLGDAAKVMGVDMSDAGGKAVEGLQKTESAAKEASQAAGASLHDFQESAKEMRDTVQGAFDDAHNSAEQAFSVNAFEAWEKNAENGMGKLGESLAKQSQAMQEYARNFGLISEDLRKRSPEFLEYVQNLGKDGAQLVSDLADAFKRGDTKAVDELIEKYKEALNAQDEIADISAKNKVALKKGLGELGSTAKEWAAFDETIRKIKSSGLPQALTEELEKTVKRAKEEGIKIPEGLASEIESSEDPVNAVISCIGKLNGAIDGQKTALYNVAHDTGHQVGAGFVLGLQEKYGDVIDAATGMVNVALEKARARARIESPSKLFRDEVGKFIAAGVAAGIKDGNSLTEKAAEEQMNETLASMKRWLVKNKAGAEEIAYTWQSVATAALKNGFGISKTKTEGSGEDAKTVQKTKSEYAGELLQAANTYLQNLKELYDVSTKQEISYWKAVRKRLDSGTQAWVTASGKIRKLQKQASQEDKAQRNAEKQEVQQYYAGLLSSCEEYIGHRKAMGNVSAEQERRYWEKQISAFRKGSDEFKKIQEKIVSLDAQIVSDRLATYEAYISHRSAMHELSIQDERTYWAEHLEEFKKGSAEFKSVQERIAALEAGVGTSEVAASVLSAYQTYFETSEKAVAQYWAVIRKTYKEGTEDRLAADREYIAAKEALNARLLSIESEYQEKIDAATERYKDAVKARREAIYNAFGLFDEFESSSVGGEQLLFNIQSQAAGYEEWIKALDELRGRGVFSEELLKELQEKGPTDIAAIKALLTLTDEQMRLYQEAYDKKLELSNAEAKKENAELKKEVKAEIKELKSGMKTALAEASEPITDELKTVAKKIETVAADQTAAIVAALSNGEYMAMAKREEELKAIAKAEKERDEAAREARAITAAVEDGEAAERRAEEAEKEIREEEKRRALDAIQGAKKLSKPLTDEQRKQHAQIYNYLADKYGVAGSAALYTRLASIFGLPEYGGTGPERMKILEELKAHGLRKGALRVGSGSAWMDEELDTTGPEIIVRKSDKAILTRLEASDAVVPADLAKNLFAWGAINPKDINTASMAALNERLSQAYGAQADAVRKNTDIISGIFEMLGNYLPHLADGQEIRLDTGALVGGIAEGMSRELARRARRTVR